MEEKLFKYLTFLRDFSRVYTQQIMEGNIPLNSDLKLSQLKALYAFRDTDCITMKEFALNLGVKFPNMTMIVDGLEQEGIVQRERGREDRRKVFVSLSDKGKEIRDSFLAQRGRIAEDIFANITEQERDLLLESLENVCRIFGKSFEDRMAKRKM
ncbi:MAG: MarR family transcriptional regulator [Deltaproteobacteria bacterium]|nr:MarR family transcriptional regulator [Deltaproteobacteria bacterium]